MPGRKPKASGQTRHRNKATHEWIEVVNVPFDGKPPVRPPGKRRTLLGDGGVVELALHPLTRQWWRRISTMPHCRLWTASDWQFAVETALVADALFYGRTTAATELRQREKVLGTTVDARRDLRIKYVDPPEPEAAGEVTRLDDYRDL